MMTNQALFAAIVNGQNVTIPTSRGVVCGRVLAIEAESGGGKSWNVIVRHPHGPKQTVFVRTTG